MTTASVLDTFRGLPVHVLVLHATVVLVPLVALAVAAVAAVPAWRARVVLPAAGAAVLLVPLVGVTVLSGRELEGRLAASGPVQAAIDRHEDLGNALFWWVVAFAVASVVLAVAAGPVARHRWVAGTNVLAAAVVLLAVATLVQTVRTGEAGTSAVWRDIVSTTSPG